MVPPAPVHPRTAGDERALARYVRRTVYPYSEHYRRLLGPEDRSGAMARLAPSDLSDITDPGALVLRPDLGRIVKEGQRRFAVRTLLAKVLGGMHGYNRRVVERRFKPVQWVLAEGVPIGYSAADLQRLGARGQEWLERAGVGRSDVVVSLLAPGPTVPHWQLALGARRAGVSAIHLDPAVSVAVVEGFVPSVLVGDSQHLVGFLAQMYATGRRWANLRTVIAVGDPLSAELRHRLRELAGGVTVIGAWAPAGVRAGWTECYQGATGAVPTGYHAWDDDVLELTPGEDGSGELLWSGVGWGGSVLLRVRTNASVFLETAPCPACGRRQPRIVPVAPVPRAGAPRAVAAGPPVVTNDAVEAPPAAAEEVRAPAPSDDAVPSLAATGAEAVLDAESDVATWQVEYRTVGRERETIVFLAPVWGAATVPLIRRLDRHLRATQFVVLPPDEIAARIARAGGQRIVGDAP